MRNGMSIEDRVARLEDREAIKELKHRYGYYIDARRWEAFEDLFTGDVVLEYSGEGLNDFEGKSRSRRMSRRSSPSGRS